MGVLSLGLIGVTLFITREIIGKPIEQLRASIERSRTDGVLELVAWQSDDELGQVVTAYNEMQGKQEAALKRHQDQLDVLGYACEIADDGRDALAM